MQFKQVTAISIHTVLVALSFAEVARALDATEWFKGKQERDVVIAAVQAVVPEGLVRLDGRWLCQSTSVDPKCQINGAINHEYQIGVSTLARLSVELQFATGNKWNKPVGGDRPTVRVERPWLDGDSVVVTVQVQSGNQSAPSDTLTTLHDVVLGVVDGRITTRSVEPSTERLTSPRIPADSGVCASGRAHMSDTTRQAHCLLSNYNA